MENKMANIIVLGAAGFIGTNLILELAKNRNNIITAVDIKSEYLEHIKFFSFPNVRFYICDFYVDSDYDEILIGQDVVYHLVSTTIPANSNKNILQEFDRNVAMSISLFDACIRQRVKKILFMSSGGTVYGKDFMCPVTEKCITNPISSYGLQKLTIEKLLYLYEYMYGLDYRVIRLANPYGPYQRPNGILGAVTTFIYKAMKKEEIVVYGDGSVVRDFIYIDDVIDGIINISEYEGEEKIFNLGSGHGTSIGQLLTMISNSLDLTLNIRYEEARAVDVPVNILDVSRYEKVLHRKAEKIFLDEGIKKTSEFLSRLL